MVLRYKVRSTVYTTALNGSDECYPGTILCTIGENKLNNAGSKK